MRMPSTIKVWTYKATPPATSKVSNTKEALDKLVNMVLLLAAIIFVLRNFDYVVRNYIL
jgi:hypothetical protein